MLKYELLPKQLLHEGTAEPTDFYSPEPIDLSFVHAVHTLSYVKSLTELTLDAKAIRSIGFPLSAELVERELRIAQGTVAGCDHALEHGIALTLLVEPITHSRIEVRHFAYSTIKRLQLSISSIRRSVKKSSS